jgi:hypothetical protein
MQWTCIHDIQGTANDIECGSLRPIPRRRDPAHQFFRVLTNGSFRQSASTASRNRSPTTDDAPSNPDAPEPSAASNGDPDDTDPDDDDDDEFDSDDSDVDNDVAVFIGGLLRWSPAANRQVDRSEQVIRIALPATITWNGQSAAAERASGSADSRNESEDVRQPPSNSRRSAGSPQRFFVGSSVDERVRLMSAFDMLAGIQASHSSVNLTDDVRPPMADDDADRGDDAADDLQFVRGRRCGSPSRICRPVRRLTHYVDEPNVGRGYIKEITFGAGGRIIASPFGFGVRLLAFDADCSELCDCTDVGGNSSATRTPVQLREVVANVNHGSVVVTTRFSPGSSMLVSGSLAGKVCFHQPRW